MILKKYFVMLALLFTAIAVKPLYAQDSTTLIKSWILQLQARYHNAGYLGFHIKYLYANAGTSSTPLDSLTGEVEMHGSQCRLLIDNTETVVNDRYTIQVRQEDKMIVLSATHPTGNMDPIGIMDSLMAHTGHAKSQLLHEGGQDILLLEFPPGSQYSNIRIMTDPHTGYIGRISYTLRTAAWVAQDMIIRPGHPAPYEPEGRIDIIFSQYRQGGFDQALFNEANYFNKIDGRFEATGRFKDYRIFLASSNL